MSSWQDDAVRLRDEGKTFPEIARMMREQYHQIFSDEQIRGVYRRRKEGQRIQKERVTFEDIRVSSEGDIEAYLEQVIALQEAQSTLDTRQVDAALTINDDKPIGIAHTADWHVGGFGTDLRLLRDDTNRIRDTEGLYSVFLGDAGENYIQGTPAGGQFQQIIQPTRQYEIAEYFMERIQHTLLAAVKGCHDTWSDKQGSHNFIDLITKNTRAVNLWHGGTLTVNLGNESYRGHLRHKFNGESRLNPLLPCRRMMEHYGVVDWAALAHKHFCAMQQSQMAGQDVLFLRPGSYKVLDEHGQQIGGYAGLPRVPVIILYPDTHRIDGYDTLTKGIEALRHARGEA
jgi:hypothetical protein